MKRKSLFEVAIENVSKETIAKRIGIMAYSFPREQLTALATGCIIEIEKMDMKKLFNKLPTEVQLDNKQDSISFELQPSRQIIVVNYNRTRYYENDDDKYGTFYPSKNKIYPRTEIQRDYNSFDVSELEDCIISAVII